MKAAKRLGILILGVLCSLSFASEQDITPPTGAWQRGVVAVDHRNRETTGFYVAPDLVLTAAHISQSGIWQFYGCYPYWGWSPECGILQLVPVFIDIDNDLLLLRANKTGKHIFKNFIPAVINDTVWVVGYQDGFASAEKAGVAYHVNTRILGLDQRIAPLGSGSPAVNKNGDVVGMIRATDEYFTVFVPADVISNFLERYYQYESAKRN